MSKELFIYRKYCLFEDMNFGKMDEEFVFE